MAIELNKQEVAETAASIRRFFREELEVDLSEMQSGFVLSYFLKEVAPFAYNQGVKDAESFFRARVEELSGTCFEDPLIYWSKKRKP